MKSIMVKKNLQISESTMLSVQSNNFEESSRPNRGRTRKLDYVGVRACCFGLCKNYTRKGFDHKKLRFFNFPLPCQKYKDEKYQSALNLISKTATFKPTHNVSNCSQCTKCVKWIQLARRADKNLKLETVGYQTYVCSDHFVSGMDADTSKEDPLPATADVSKFKKPRKSPSRRNIAIPFVHSTKSKITKPNINDKKNCFLNINLGLSSSDKLAVSIRGEENFIQEIEHADHNFDLSSSDKSTISIREDNSIQEIEHADHNFDLSLHEGGDCDLSNVEVKPDSLVQVVYENVNINDDFQNKLKTIIFKYITQCYITCQNNGITLLKETTPFNFSHELFICEDSFKLKIFGRAISDKLHTQLNTFFEKGAELFLEKIFKFPICPGFEIDNCDQRAKHCKLLLLYREEKCGFCKTFEKHLIQKKLKEKQNMDAKMIKNITANRRYMDKNTLKQRLAIKSRFIYLANQRENRLRNKIKTLISDKEHLKELNNEYLKIIMESSF